MSNTVTAIKDHVIFKFKEKVHKGQFTEEKIGDIVLAYMGKDHRKDAEYSRVATVVAIGPLCKAVKPGDVVIVEKHKWTPAFTVCEDSFWRTTEEFILGHVDPD